MSSINPNGIFNAFTTNGCQTLWVYNSNVNPAQFSFGFCATTAACGDYFISSTASLLTPQFFTSGQVNATATPEPNAWILLATGGFALMAAKRFNYETLSNVVPRLQNVFQDLQAKFWPGGNAQSASNASRPPVS